MVRERKIRPITEPKLLAVEGKDECRFFRKFILELELENIDIRDVGGRTQFRARLYALKDGSGFAENVTSLGIVRDADENPEGAFQSICSTLEALDLPVPEGPLKPAGEELRVTVMILPGKGRKGMLEDLCLESVAGDPCMTCVEAYFECLEGQLEKDVFPNNQAKASVRTFLAAMEWVEEGYFESIQNQVKVKGADSPTVPKVHAFLASRYKPNLDLGIAAEKGYWPLDHPAFEQVKQFISIL